MYSMHEKLNDFKFKELNNIILGKYAKIREKILKIINKKNKKLKIITFLRFCFNLVDYKLI